MPPRPAKLAWTSDDDDATRGETRQLLSLKKSKGKDDVTAENVEQLNESLTYRNICIGALAVIALGLLAGIIILVVQKNEAAMPALSLLTMAPNQLLASRTACPLESSPLTNDLERMRVRIRNEAARRDAVPWALYAATPATNAGRRVVMSNADFANGTLRIVTTGHFVLDGDVHFEPNADNDFRPNRTGQPQYAGAPYILDFFAAITVEANDVVIDLNGHTLRQTNVHAAQQRFYANIELSNQPFITGQGPAGFGAAPFSVNGLVIENGRLGRSSHHGVHGNGGRRVLMQDVEFVDYEVAAIALNGFKDVLIRRVHALGQSTSIPVLGTYSNARFLLPFIARVLGSPLVTAPKKLALAGYRDVLVDLMNDVVGDVRDSADSQINVTTHPAAHALFANPTGLCDGNSYSLLLHPNGVAVGAFWSADPPASGSDAANERIYVRDSSFNHTHIDVVEVVALVSPQNISVRGPAGDVLRIVDNTPRPNLMSAGDGNYVGNALADAQLALIDASLDVTNATLRKMLFGTTHGDAHVVEWWRGQRTMRSLVENEGFHYWRNGDTMFHVNKGVVGIRVDGSRDVCFDRVVVAHTSNTGARGNTYALPGEENEVEAAYVGATDGGHPDQAAQYGYMGADARGIAVSGSAGVYFDEVRVDDVHARFGFARGIDVFNHAQELHVGALCSINNVTTLITDSDDIMTGDYTMGPKVGAAAGMHCSGGSAAKTFGGSSIVVTNVVSGSFDQAHTIVVGSTMEQADVLSIHPNTYEL